MSINDYTPVKIIGISDDGSYMPIVARPEFRLVNHLKGQKIGVIVGSQYELLVDDMLRQVGMQMSDINLIDINIEDAPALLARNRIQASFIWEPFTSGAIAAGNHIMYPKDQSLRLFPHGIVFLEKIIAERPDEIRAFMRAWFEAVEYRLANPEETREIAAKYIDVRIEQINIDNNLRVYTYTDNLSLYNPDLANLNSLFAVAERTSRYLVGTGTLKEIPNISALLDPQYFIIVP